jgi:putative Mn2+ efflux pump MntP
MVNDELTGVCILSPLGFAWLFGALSNWFLKNAYVSMRASFCKEYWAVKGTTWLITISSIVAPLMTFLASMIIGASFNFFAIPKVKRAILLVVFAIVVSSLALILATEFRSTLTLMYEFQSFAAIFEAIGIDLIRYNAPIVASLILVAIMEIGLAGGFIAACRIGSTQAQDNPVVVPLSRVEVKRMIQNAKQTRRSSV